MDKRLVPFGIVIAVLLAGFAALYWSQTHPAPAAATATPTPTPEEPAIRFPLPPSEATGPLPALAESDAFAAQLLARLFGEPVAKLVIPDRLIHKFVATVDNLPTKNLPQQSSPFKPVDGLFTPGPENHRRYLPYVLLAEAVDAPTLFAAYQSIYPLLQKAYEDLGYPDAYFNDRVVVAIDDLLAAPEIAAPALTQPNVLYVFADPDLESRSAGQKILIRMGPENATRVKARLRALRIELTRGTIPP